MGRYDNGGKADRGGNAGGRQEPPSGEELAALKKQVWARVVAWESQFGRVLPSHLNVKAWLASALAALERDVTGALWRAAANSFDALMVALFRAAQMGLEPGTEEFYLTVRKGKILGVPGYQGEVEMIYRAGAVSSVVVEVVRKGDTFSWNRARDRVPNHEPDWFEERGPRGDLIGVYAYAVMKDGATSQVVVLNKRQIEEIKAASDYSDGANSPWVKWEESMWLKSAAHRLRKWVPTSKEYRSGQARAIAGAEADVAARGPAAIPTEFAAAAQEHDDDDTAPAPTPRPAPTPPRGLPAAPSESYPMPAGVTPGAGQAEREYDPTAEPGWGGPR